MNNLITRVVTGVIGGAIVVGAITNSPYGVWLFGVIVGTVSMWEYLRATNISQKVYRITIFAFVAWIWLLLLAELMLAELVELSPIWLQLSAFLLLPLLEIITLFNGKEEEPVHLLGKVLLGFFYVLIPFILFFRISVPEIITDYDYRVPMGILALTWVLDSFAYFVGKAIGKHHLYARVSPKKTWEGAIGGALCCIAAGALMEYWIIADSKYNWIIIASIICVFSQIGDLVESMFKRNLLLKDSGKILPGHGGMLDRFDGFLLSVPFLYFYFSVI